MIFIITFEMSSQNPIDNSTPNSIYGNFPFVLLTGDPHEAKTLSHAPVIQGIVLIYVGHSTSLTIVDAVENFWPLLSTFTALFSPS